LKIRYFTQTDTLLITLSDRDILETRDLTENVLIDVDKEGKPVSITIEHAQGIANLDEFSYQQITSGR